MADTGSLHLRFDAFELDEGEARLNCDGRPVPLPPRAFAVLCTLARQPGKLVTKNALLDAVWGHQHVSESVLKTTISELRAAQMLADYRKVIALAVGGLREAYEVLDITYQGLRAEHERVASLARAKDLATFGYENGAYGYLDVLDAERNLYQAQLDEVGAYRDRLIGQVAVFRALGGGYGGNAKQDLQRVALETR